ncbi:MAG: DUF4131 domain-containing protein, partial [Pirellulales bacterium]|nr:DUF4131 domain-containing protein [Pirellulales bacterium]
MAGSSKGETCEPRYAPLASVLAAVSVGIVLDRFYPLTVPTWLLAATSMLMAWLWFFRRGWDKPALVMILLAGACSGGARHHLCWSLFSENDIAFLATKQQKHTQIAQPICLRAEVTGGSRRLPAPPYDPMRIIPPVDRTRLELRVTECRHGAAPGGNTWRPADGRATLIVDGHVLGIHAGNQVEVLATLRRVAPPCNPGQFDYASHLRADGK